MRNLTLSLLILMAFGFVSCRDKDTAAEASLPETVSERPKVLFIDSYHAEFPWVMSIMEGLYDVFQIDLDAQGEPVSSTGLVELKIYHMDTKRNSSLEFIENAAQEARDLITEWQPGIVIASDDNASKYLIAPYYLGRSLPFVFCGVNWDASEYGFPAENVTGILEVQLIDQLVKELSLYSRGDSIGFLKGDSLTARKEGSEFEKLLGREIVQAYARDYEDWESLYRQLQKQVDILLVGHLEALPDWDRDMDKLSDFMIENTEIPTGSWDPWFSPMVLVTYAQMGEEQGRWSAETALKILSGLSPREIPIARNKQAAVYLNMDLAKKLGIKFPQELIERSHLVSRDSGN